jgi:agmatine deiminase
VEGKSLDIMALPMPRPIIRENQRLPASYANFYIANTSVLLPTFDDPNDEKAVEILQQAFPGRRIVPIDCRELVWGLGAFHCLTQQQPQTSSS